MEATTNTLLDRLVLRTAQGENGIEPPAETPFEPSEQETFTDVPMPRRLVPVQMAEAPKLSGRTQNAAPARQVIAPPSAAIPTSTPSKPGAPPLRQSTVKETTVVPRVRTIREPYAVERVRNVAGPEKVVTTAFTENIDHEEKSLPAKMAMGRAAIEPDLVPDVVTKIARTSEGRGDREVTVNVTIGRLEIKRSGTEKQKDSRRPKTREGNSLEQYLSKRRGGGA